MPKTPQAKPWTFGRFSASSAAAVSITNFTKPRIHQLLCVRVSYLRATMYLWFWNCQAENIVGYLSLTYCTRYSGRWWRHCLPGLELKNSADRLAMAGLNPPLLWRFSLWWYPLRGLIIADIVAFFCIFYFQVLTRCCLVLRLTVTDHETESFTSEWRTVQTSVNNAIIVVCPLAYQSP